MYGEAWLRQKIGTSTAPQLNWCGTVPSSFRRMLNREYRAKVNQYLREAFRDQLWSDSFGNFEVPHRKERRNTAWDYW
jgi:hypothetical protein